MTRPGSHPLALVFWPGLLAATVAVFLAIAGLWIAVPQLYPGESLRLPLMRSWDRGCLPMGERFWLSVGWSVEQLRRPREQRDPQDFLFRRDTTLMDVEELGAALQDYARRSMDERGRSKMAVGVMCDEGIAFAAVRQIADCCERAGIWKLWLRGRAREEQDASGRQIEFVTLPWAGETSSASEPSGPLVDLSATEERPGAFTLSLDGSPVPGVDLLGAALERRGARIHDRENARIRAGDDVLWKDVAMAISTCRATGFCPALTLD